MATIYFGIAREENIATVDTSTTSKEIELAVDDAVGITRYQLLKALDRVRRTILETEDFNDI